MPLLIRLLFPKLRKRSGRLGGKGASGSARAAILNFLAALEPLELRPLLELFLEPLSAAVQRPAGLSATGSGSGGGSGGSSGGGGFEWAGGAAAGGSAAKRRRLDAAGNAAAVTGACDAGMCFLA